MAKQNITLRIDCYTIPLQVEREDEAVWRKAAVLLNETYKRYAAAYQQKQVPVEKLWIYTALEIAVKMQRDVQGKELQPLLERLARLNDKLTETQQRSTSAENPKQVRKDE